MRAEKELWAAVVAQAVSDVRDTDRVQEARPTPKERREAERWLMSNDSRIGGYLWICDLLGLAPHQVREAISIRRIL